MVRRERLANNAETVLASAVVPADGTITVANPTNFPTEGDFRIAIDNELMLVTSVSGSTFTVTRAIEGTTASNHTESTPLAAILTKEGMQRLISESVDPFAFSRNPYRIQDTNGNLLTASDFTALTGSNTTVVDNSDGSISVRFLAPSATERLPRFVRTAPSTPYTITMATKLTAISAGTVSGPVFGPIFRDSVNDETLLFRLRPFADLSDRLSVNHLAAEVFQATLFTRLRAEPSPSATIWWQIEDDGTNLFWRISANGVDWVEVHTEGRTATMTGAPDQVGFAIDNANVTLYDAIGTLMAYDGE